MPIISAVKFLLCPIVPCDRIGFNSFGRSPNRRKENGVPTHRGIPVEIRSKNAQDPYYGRRFLVRNQKLYLFLLFTEQISKILSLLRPNKSDKIPRKILLGNLAHIGDLLISTAALRALKEQYPDCEIGFLVGSWARSVVTGHSLVKHIHIFDNYFMNRSKDGTLKKLITHYTTLLRAVREIRKEKYDLYIDLYYYWPNAVPLTWLAGVPRRIGYESGGFGPLLTERLPWDHDMDRPMAVIQSFLLRSLGVAQETIEHPRMMLDPLPLDIAPILSKNALTPQGYVILHPGTGARPREWPLPHWIELAQMLDASGHRIVLTGRGAREAELCREIEAAVPSVVDLCDKLSWSEFRQVVRFAALLVGVESMAPHLASAQDTPAIAIYSGITSTKMMAPLGNCVVLTMPVPCAPCLIGSGCDTRDCLVDQTPDAVFRACEDRLRSGRTA